MWFSSIASIRARSPRNENSAAIFEGASSSPRRHRRRSRTGCDQACGRPTLSVEKPLVEKRRAAAPRTCGIISTERVGRLHAWSQICDCAGGAVVKMPSLAARAVPPASVARLLAAWCGPAEWRSVQGESPAPRGVKSEQGSPALSRATICRNRAGRVSLECRPRYELM